MKLGLSKSCVADYDAVARAVVQENLPVTDALERALTHAYKVMRDTHTFLMKREMISPLGECIHLAKPGNPDCTVLKQAKDTISSGLKEHFGLPSVLRPWIRCQKVGEITISPQMTTGEYYPAAGWRCIVTKEDTEVILNQKATIEPFDVDPDSYTTDTDEMVVNEAGKRKRKFPQGSQLDTCIWEIQINVGGDGTKCIIRLTGDRPPFSGILAQHRTAQNFERELVLLRALLLWARSKGIEYEVRVDRTMSNPDDLQKGELSAIDLVMF